MTLSDIQNKVYFLTKTNSSNYTNADMLIAINNAYNRVASLILRSDDRWSWDDSNQTDLPSATASLVSSQQQYTLATSHLSIDRVEVKDTAGNWTELDQIDQQMLKGAQKQALASYLSTAGKPLQYDLIGASVLLYPMPNYNQSASLKLYFTRGPAEFTSGQLSSGTAVLGFNSLFHELVPLWIAYDFAVANGRKTASGFLAAINLKEAELYRFYGLRNRDMRPRFTVSTNKDVGAQSGSLSGVGGDSNK